MKKGVYTIGVNKHYITWVINLALLRSLYFSGLRPLVNCFFLFKFVFYRALGAKVPVDLGTAINSEFVDLSLITIGKNSFLGDGVKVSCHMFLKGKLILRPVVIGNNCVIENHAEIRPGTVLGDGELFSREKK
jgi:acetyltransferase-like isoleucine patch superfamily enzyme